MKRRWSVLFWCALSTMIGAAMLTQRYDMPLSQWLRIQFIGMIAAVIVSGVAMIKAYPRKWPAAVVLICAAPLSQLIGGLGLDLIRVLAFFGVAGLLLLGGTFATAITAIVILSMRPPKPPPDDPVAKATVVR